jgi:hypothetical protein
VASSATVAFGRPQYSTTSSSGGKLQVSCQQSLVRPGVYSFNCVGVDPAAITLQSEHILWLNGNSGNAQQLDVVIPNYRVEELIRAAQKAGSGGSTSVNILLKKPETVYDVQAQDGTSTPDAPPSVNLQYEDVPAPVSVHYPTEKQYSPLSGPIREP